MNYSGPHIVAPNDIDPAELERIRAEFAAAHGCNGSPKVLVLDTETKRRLPIRYLVIGLCATVAGVCLVLVGLPILGVLVSAIGNVAALVVDL